MSGRSWAPAREKQLAALHRSGATFDVIAERIGAPSAKAARAKARSLGLDARLSGKPWSADELESLRDFWASGLSCRLIGQKLNRTKSSVISKANKLGLDPRQSPVPRKKDLPAAPVPRLLLGSRPATMTTASGITLPRISMLMMEDAE